MLCPHADGNTGSVDCTFENINQCGYVDQSSRTIKWVRTKHVNKGKCQIITCKV